MKLLPTLPGEWYRDPLIFERERRAIFGREWIYAGHENEVQTPGESSAFELHGVPIALVRGRDGVVRVFKNVCRHRGAQVFKAGCDRAGGAVVCRYHGWSYELDGTFINGPHLGELDDSCRAELGLHQVRSANHRGLIFVNFDDRAPPFEEKMRDLVREIESSTYPLERFAFHSKVSVEGNFNWKVWVDGYQECYHCPMIHPVFNKDFQLKSYRVENRSLCSVHSCERRADAASTSGTFQGLWLWVHPNLGMPCYERGWYTLAVQPLAPACTRLTYTFHFPSGEDAAAIAEFKSFVDQVTREDVGICEDVQRNINAGNYQRGHLHPERENGVHYFHSLVRDALALEQ